MKQATAFKYIVEIARRLHSINGLLATPGCGSEAVRIKRAWVFGSTVKGKKEPADLDLLLEIERAGRSRIPSKRARLWPREFGRLLDGQTDKPAMRCMGVRICPCPQAYAMKWLTKNMRMVSRHTTFNEGKPFAEQVLIYPRLDVDFDAIRKMEYVDDQRTIQRPGQTVQNESWASS